MARPVRPVLANELLWRQAIIGSARLVSLLLPIRYFAGCYPLGRRPVNLIDILLNILCSYAPQAAAINLKPSQLTTCEEGSEFDG